MTMVTLQEVQKCLYDNPNLTEEVKENMDFLIQVFNKKLPEVDLTNLSNNLKTLDFETTSKFVSNIPLYYDSNRNKLVIVKSELEQDYDAKYLMMVAIIDMMAKRGELYE